MSDERLEVHIATELERVAIFRNTFPIWGRPGGTLEEHIAVRQQSPQFQRARWYAGSLAGQIVCGLAAYPIELRLHGIIHSAIAIGSVHTIEEYRRRGLAAQLMDAVEHAEAARGATVSLLYSDIAPRYYVALGYRLCPAWEGTRFLKDVPTDAHAKVWDYEPADPHDHRETFADLYDRSHANEPLAIARSRDYWDFLFRKGLEDEFALLREGGTAKTYVRVRMQGDSCVVRDWGAMQEHLSAMFRSLFAEGQRRGWTSISGWLPDRLATRSLFNLQPRTRELTMVKPLQRELKVDDASVACTDLFREIDHV